MKQNYYLALDTAERRLIIESLNNLRSRLIAAGRFTDAVDAVAAQIRKCQGQKIQGHSYGIAGGNDNDGI